MQPCPSVHPRTRKPCVKMLGHRGNHGNGDNRVWLAW